MTTRTPERDRLDSWDLEWDESDAKAEQLVARFQEKLAEQEPDLLSEILSSSDGDRAWLRDPTGQEATAIFDALQEAGRSEDLTFTDRVVMRDSVIDMITTDATQAVEQDGQDDVADLLANGKRMMSRGAAMGSTEVFYRGLSDVRTAQRRSEAGDAVEQDSDVANERALVFADRWQQMASDATVPSELSVNDDRSLNNALRTMKEVHDQLSLGLSIREQYQLAGAIADQFLQDARDTAANIAQGDPTTAFQDRPGAVEMAAAQRIAAGAVSENLASARDDMAEALVHVDPRWIHDAGHTAAWALEDLSDLRAGRQLSTAAFEGNHEADRRYSELWDLGRRAA